MRITIILTALALLCGLSRGEVVVDVGTLSGEYAITDSDTYVVTGEAIPLNGWINVRSGSPVLKLDGVKAMNMDESRIIRVESQDPVTIVLVKDTESQLAVLVDGSPAGSWAPIDLGPGARVTIDGEGALWVYSSVTGSACIGTGPDCSSTYDLTVAGGYIEMSLPDQGAGLGGGRGGHARVTVTGGNIMGYGSVGSHASTIGCGLNGYLDYVELCGGVIQACGSQGAPGIGCVGAGQTDEGCIAIREGLVLALNDAGGVAIGAESGLQPRIEITGGNVVLVAGTMGAQPVEDHDISVYSAIMEDIAFGMTSVVLTVQQGGQDYPYIYSCDDPEALEEVPYADFYLPPGDYIVSGGVQQYAGTVTDAGDCVFMAVPEPALALLALLGLVLLKRP